MFVLHLLSVLFSSVLMVLLAHSLVQDSNGLFDSISLDPDCDDSNNQPVKARAATGSPDDSTNQDSTGFSDNSMNQVLVANPDNPTIQDPTGILDISMDQDSPPSLNPDSQSHRTY